MKRSTLRRRLYLLFLQWLGLLLGTTGLVTLFSFARFRHDALEERLLLGRTLARSTDATLGELFQGMRRLAAELG